jgi:hypothetical protein
MYLVFTNCHITRSTCIIIYQQKHAIKWSIAAYNNYSTVTASSNNNSTESNSELGLAAAPSASPFPSGSPDFHLSFARYYRITEISGKVDFNSSHSHYLLAAKSRHFFAKNYPLNFDVHYSAVQDKQDYLQNIENHAQFIQDNSAEYSDLYNEHASLILNWILLGNASEIDLFITRAALQYLCLSDLKGANQLLNAIMNTVANSFHIEIKVAELSNSPLIHFLQFLLKTVERSAGPLFDLLKHKYQLALTRDPSFSSYLDKIGAIYFGRPQPKGMFDSLLQGF